MKRLGIIVILTASLLLCSCTDKYCPCFPTDEVAYLPVDYVGQTLRYLIDDDTVTFIVQQPEFSEKYPYADAIEIADKCSSYAIIKLISGEEDGYLSYTKILHMPDYHVMIDRWSMTLYAQKDGNTLNFTSLEKLGTKGYYYEILPVWTSPTGVSYVNVCCMTDFTEADTAYFSKSLGLLHIKTANTCWILLP